MYRLYKVNRLTHIDMTHIYESYCIVHRCVLLFRSCDSIVLTYLTAPSRTSITSTSSKIEGFGSNSWCSRDWDLLCCDKYSGGSSSWSLWRSWSHWCCSLWKSYEPIRISPESFRLKPNQHQNPHPNFTFSL